MKKLFKHILIVGLAISAFACSDPIENTAVKSMPYGDWDVVEYYVDGQSQGSNIVSRFILERDNSFLLEDLNGLVHTGVWNVSGDVLTLTQDAAEGEEALVRTYIIVFISSSKMQLLQEESIGSEAEVRYLLNHNDTDTYRSFGSSYSSI